MHAHEFLKNTKDLFRSGSVVTVISWDAEGPRLHRSVPPEAEISFIKFERLNTYSLVIIYDSRNTLGGSVREAAVSLEAGLQSPCLGMCWIADTTTGTTTETR